MKIALVIEHFDATRGAAEHLAVWTAGKLAERGHEVHVVCQDVAARVNRYRQATLRASHDAGRSFQAHPPGEVAHEGIHIHRLRGMQMNTGLGFRRFGARARAWCKDHSPEVIHSFTVAFCGDIYHAGEGVFAEIEAQAAASRGKDGTLTRVLSRFSIKRRTVAALERRMMEGVSRRRAPEPRRIISLSAMMTEQFGRHYTIAAKRIVELATPRLDVNGSRQWSAEKTASERAWFRGHYQLGEGDRVALFVGHDFRRKGLRHAIEAIARTRRDETHGGWKLLVVGLGKVREYVELAETLGLNGDEERREAAQVLFVGPTREMDRVYAAADAILLPTFYEPWGLIVPEALGHGLPVISTAFLGSAEAVKQKRLGTIVSSPRAVTEMAEALDALPAAGTRENEQLAARARAAGAGVSPASYMDALLRIYDDVRKEQ